MSNNLKRLTEITIPLPENFTGIIQVIKHLNKRHLEYCVKNNVLYSITHFGEDLEESKKFFDIERVKQ